MSYIGAPFIPWWDERETGPAPNCEVCGCMMVHTYFKEGVPYRTNTRMWPEQTPQWYCMSCGDARPAPGA